MCSPWWPLKLSCCGHWWWPFCGNLMMLCLFYFPTLHREWERHSSLTATIDVTPFQHFHTELILLSAFLVVRGSLHTSITAPKSDPRSQGLPVSQDIQMALVSYPKVPLLTEFQGPTQVPYVFATSWRVSSLSCQLPGRWEEAISFLHLGCVFQEPSIHPKGCKDSSGSLYKYMSILAGPARAVN